jgi:hypothetical protein
MIASDKSLDIRYTKPKDFPNTPRANVIRLRVGCMPFLQLDLDSLNDNTLSLPGLDIRLTSNVAKPGAAKILFSKANKLYGAFYYEVVYTFEDDLEEPHLCIEYTKTEPPAYPLAY